MSYRTSVLTAITTFFVTALSVSAQTNTVIIHNVGSAATRAFKFRVIPGPSADDLATDAAFTIVSGQRDANSGELERLHDGQVPTVEDQPSRNFFFDAGTEGGRLLVDLGAAADIEQINTYSWHPDSRGPQVYVLYAAGPADGFDPSVAAGVDPISVGWTRIANVDTRPEQEEVGGQYGVSIFSAQATLGKYRYLLFNISQTETDDLFGNTFFSEIDVVGTTARATTVTEEPDESRAVYSFVIENGSYNVKIDTTATPDLTEWANNELAPVVREWYPKIVDILPSEGYQAPREFSITFNDSNRGVASASGTRINCSSGWFRNNLQGEAKGAVVHEMVHVVQQYGGGRRGRGRAGGNPNALHTPGWLQEGIPDYIRWFMYEPYSRGAEITPGNIDNTRYDGNYRISANFLNWVAKNHGHDLIVQLNAELRARNYTGEIWEAKTGHDVEELGAMWKTAMEEAIAAGPEAIREKNWPIEIKDTQTQPNTLTDGEAAAGWKLLFNGVSTDGWHNFRSQRIRSGWQVIDGALVCADPRNAGDLCTDEQFAAFELKLEYNIAPAGNSGIMYHVTDQQRSAWATGPEFQLEDNAAATDPVRCGWLYALYQPPDDPATGHPLDATKPAGEWNQIRLLITPEKCAHEINGVKYFEYVIGSQDFQQRVEASKFHSMPDFAKSDVGYIALQGDHGQVRFRNIKLRPIATPTSTQVE